MKSKSPLRYAMVRLDLLRDLLGPAVADGFNARSGYAVVCERTLMDRPDLDGNAQQRAEALAGTLLNDGEPLALLSGTISPQQLLDRHGL